MSITPKPQGAVTAPNTTSQVAAGTVATPISKTVVAAGTVATPISKGVVPAGVLPRSLKPLVSLDFANNIFAQNGVAKALSTIATFTRASTATYIGRDLNVQGQYDYTVKTANAGTLRVEYDAATGKNLGALIEGGSTNLLLRSEEFDNSAWIKGNLNVTPNTVISPDGTLNADKIVYASSDVELLQNVALSTGSTATFSVWVKGVAGETIRIEFGLQPKSITLTNDWQKVSVTTTNSSNVKVSINTYGGPTAREIYLWGAQLEALPFASSYIKTEGAAVSRSGDNLSMPSAGNFSGVGYNESSISVGYNILGVKTGSNQPLFSTDVSSYILIAASGSQAPSQFNDGVLLPSTGSLSALSGISKLTVTRYSDLFSLYFDGEITNSGQGAVPSATQISLGNLSGAQHLYGHFTKVQSYNKALTAQEVSNL